MDEKSIKILEAIIMFGPITGPDILSFLHQQNISINIKTLYTIIDKWNYLFSQIGDGSMQIVGQKKLGYQMNHSYFSSGQQRFLRDAIQSSTLLSDSEKNHTCDLIEMFPKKSVNLEAQGFMNRLNTISKAIEEKKTIKFSYFDYEVSEENNQLSIVKKYRDRGNDTKTTYLISPYEIIMNKGQYYVLSYCDKHPENITPFRLDRMDQVRTTKNEYFDQLKEIVDYDSLKNQMIHMFIGTKTEECIRIKFSKDIFKTIIDEFGDQIELSKDVDGSYIFELNQFALSEGLISWIFMMGDKVEVLEPISLKREIYQRLEKLVEKYKGGM